MFTHVCILNFVMYIFSLLVAFFGVSFLYKGSNGYMKRNYPVSVGYVVFFSAMISNFISRPCVAI